MTLLGVGSEPSISGERNPLQAARQSMQRNVSRAGDQITSRNLDVSEPHDPAMPRTARAKSSELRRADMSSSAAIP